MQEVAVTATRAGSATPLAFSQIDKNQIDGRNTGQDMPYLLLTTPSVVATSDAGNGIGYTAIRLRGSDPSRINVTLNGVPMNDPESQTVFWVNLPDLASSVEDIQVQRGVGGSTNGAGAFGGSINMQSEKLSPRAGGELSGGVGSYGTYRRMIKANTGILGNHWNLYLRLSDLHSDGYVRRASTDMSSYFAQVEYAGKDFLLRAVNFAGKEKTYHAWDGIDAQQMALDRRYNPSGLMLGAAGDTLGYYKDQTDNYVQNNSQLYGVFRLSPQWTLDATLHYTRGDGYYEEYKNGRKLLEYGLQPYSAGGSTVKKSNLIRRKNMGNDLYGAIATLGYAVRHFDMKFGASANRYDGDHFGQVIWVENYQGPLLPLHEYYRSASIKDDGMIYLKANLAPVEKLNLYGDVQYRSIHHTITGLNSTWDSASSAMQPLDVHRRYNFFNPKGGVFYSPGGRHQIYASVSVGHKEPSRNNFTDATDISAPLAERMVDYEAGYHLLGKVFAAGVNLYYMDYKDQIVLTGRTNDIGEPIAENVDRSYRAGIELTATVRPWHWLRWDANATFSRNRIKDYTEYFDIYDPAYDYLGQGQEHFSDTPIAYSPEVIANSVISAAFGSFGATFTSSYVGSQYMTNTGYSTLKLGSYFVNNLQLSYSFRPRSLQGIRLALNINNLFNTMYVNNGWGYHSALDNGGAVSNDFSAGYFPQAGTNVLLNATVRF
ncbi:TonB-dependent receptor [Bacteroidia bacterium]|nr:TonB-dependent receptor [Bacteroidia bacterium]